MGTVTYSTWLLDQNAWDLVLDSSQNIALATPPYALAQDVASAIRTFLGEVWYNTELGVPYWTTVLGQLPPSALLKQLLIEQALTVPGVVTAAITITSFNYRAVKGQVTFTDVNNQTTVINF